MRVLTVLAIATSSCFACAGPHLPWYEKCFFPLGAWCMPTNDDGDRLDYTDGTGKTIAYWDPQDYYYIVSMNRSVENCSYIVSMTRTVYTCFYPEKPL